MAIIIEKEALVIRGDRNALGLSVCVCILPPQFGRTDGQKAMHMRPPLVCLPIYLLVSRVS